jgi:hypothetical protein
MANSGVAEAKAQWMTIRGQEPQGYQLGIGDKTGEHSYIWR